MKRLFLFIAALACTAVSNAQTDSLFYNLQEIEVTATRAGRESPVAHCDLSAEDINRINYGYDVPSILSSTTSVVMTTETGIAVGGTSMRIRGTDAGRTSVTVNGVSMNDPDSHAMYWYDTPDLISSVGSVQIQRGAGLSTSGCGSFGGAVNMRTADLSRDFNGDVTASYGSFGTNKAAVHIGSGLIGDKWIFDARVSHVGSDGYVDRGKTNLYSYMVQSAWYNGGTMMKFVSFGGKAKTYLTYYGATPEEIASYGRTYHSSGQYRDPDGAFTLSDGTRVSYHDDETDNYLQLNNQLIFNHWFNSANSMNLTGFYTYGKGFYKQYIDEETDKIQSKNMYNHRFGLNASYIRRSESLETVCGGSASCYTGGLYGIWNWIEGMDESEYDGVRWYENSVVKADADLFAKMKWTPFDGMSVSADLQWRHINYAIWGENDYSDPQTGEMIPLDIHRTYDFISPRVGAKYELSDRSSASASFALASNEPCRSDFTDRHNISNASEPLPERLFDYEIGYEFNGTCLDFDVNFYWMSYRDQLVPTGIINDYASSLNVNVPVSYRRGIEVSGLWKPFKWLSIPASCTLSQNRIKDYVETIDGIEFELGETTLAYSPSVIANVAANFSAGPLEAMFTTKYVSKQYFCNGGFEDLSLPAYCVSDLDLGYTFDMRRSKSSLRLGLQVGNLFNADYCSYGYGGSWLEGDSLESRQSWCYLFPQAPTNVLANLKFSF